MAGKTFTVPTIYTAIDKYTGPVVAMAGVTDKFASRTEKALGASNKLFNALTPSLSASTKQLLSFASAAAVGGGVIAAGKFGVESLMAYEDELQNLKALTGASGKDFDIFKNSINDVAHATKKSGVEVAQAFTAIANNQPELLKDAKALAAVTQSSILLAKASKMELQPAGEALTQILNQYGKGAMDAARTVDILAAGSVAGSSEIRDTAAAIQQFGTVAANAGVKIDESVALVEMASKFEKGSEAGSKLRNILITMSAIKVQDPKALKDLHRLGVNMSVVADKSLPLNMRLLEMAKISKDNAALFHVFGKENQAMAAGVLNSAGAFAGMQEQVNKAGEAARMAEENNNTLSNRITEVKNAFVNAIIGTDGQTESMERAKNVAKFLGDNMGTILEWTGKLIAAFAIWKVTMVAAKVAMFLYNVAFGINNALQKGSLFLTEGNIVAKNADLIATKAITAAQWLWNAAMAANPIGLIIIGIAALAVLIYEMIDNWEEWGAVVSLFLGPIGMVISFIKELYDNWQMVTDAFEKGGIWGAIKAIGKILLSAILHPIQSLLEAIAEVTGFDWAANAAESIKGFRGDMGINVAAEDAQKNEVVDGTTARHNDMVNQMTTNNNQNVKIDINDKTGGRAKVSSDSNMIPIKTTSTQTWDGAGGTW